MQYQEQLLKTYSNKYTKNTINKSNGIFKNSGKLHGR